MIFIPEKKYIHCVHFFLTEITGKIRYGKDIMCSEDKIQWAENRSDSALK